MPKTIQFIIACFLLVISGYVWAISYTVQVVAVSDEAAAFRLRDELAAKDFPAYLLTVPTTQGLIYRLRVGSFANRAAAVRFSETMETVSGSIPTPALAESIPQGLIPFETELLNAVDKNTTSVQIIPWQANVALRVQDGERLKQAHYTLLNITEFDAWHAVPQKDGTIIRVYSLALWPEDWSETSDDDRERFRQSILATVASELRFTPQQLAAFEFKNIADYPFLILLERFHPLTNERSRLKALGQPSQGMTAYGPEIIWFEPSEDFVLSLPSLLFTLDDEASDLELGEAEFLGNGWQAFEDSGFVKLHVEDPEKSYRAANGQPVWARNDLLLTVDENDILIYRIEIP